jgi:hypothetical protein
MRFFKLSIFGGLLAAGNPLYFDWSDQPHLELLEQEYR